MAWRRPRQTPSEYVFPVTFSMVRRHAAKSIQRTICLQSVKGNELCVLARFEFSPESESQPESRPRVFVIGFSCIGQSSPSFQVAKVGSVSLVVGLQSFFAKFPMALEKF